MDGVKNPNENKQPAVFFTPAKTLAAALVVFISIALSLFASLFLPYSFTGEKTATVYVIYGSGLRKISSELDSQGLLRSRLLFEAYVMITGTQKKLRAGEYEFSQKESMAQIAGKMARGEVLKHKVVIPEGSDIYDIADILGVNKLADPQIFLLLVKDRDFIKGLGLNYPSLEGFLFPDTYYFVIGEGEKRIIEAMYGRFREKSAVDPAKTYAAGGLTMSGYKVLKLASIIEKESRLDAERPKVASVFYNRMKSAEAYQRRLESCATVRYALNKKTGAITYKDTRVDSPYNTYIVLGLPPTPICNPGLKSMEAALNPADTNYRYFVVKESGEHAFSETLEQHDSAKKEYKKKKRAGEL